MGSRPGKTGAFMTGRTTVGPGLWTPGSGTLGDGRRRLGGPLSYTVTWRRKAAASSGRVGFTWKPVVHSSVPDRVTFGRISMCQW